MADILLDIGVVVVYLGVFMTLCGIGVFLGVGDFGFWCFGKLDEYIQNWE